MGQMITKCSISLVKFKQFLGWGIPYHISFRREASPSIRIISGVFNFVTKYVVFSVFPRRVDDQHHAHFEFWRLIIFVGQLCSLKLKGAKC